MGNLTKALSVSLLGLLAVTTSCKKDKNTAASQTSLLQNKWYTKSVAVTSSNTSNGAVTSSSNKTDFSASDYIIYDNSGAYTAVGSPFSDNGKYSITTANSLTMTSTKNSTTTNWAITQLDNNTLKLESTATSGNSKLVEDIVFSK